MRWKVASDLRFRAASSEPKAPSFCGISGDLVQSTRKSLAIAIVRFWCAKTCSARNLRCASLRFACSYVAHYVLQVQADDVLNIVLSKAWHAHVCMYVLACACVRASLQTKRTKGSKKNKTSPFCTLVLAHSPPSSELTACAPMRELRILTDQERKTSTNRLGVVWGSLKPRTPQNQVQTTALATIPLQNCWHVQGSWAY